MVGVGASISEVTQVVDDFLAQFAHKAPVIIANGAVGVLPGATDSEAIACAMHSRWVLVFILNVSGRPLVRLDWQGHSGSGVLPQSCTALSL